MQMQAVVILGHGSKSQEAMGDFNFVVNALKSKLDHKNVFGAHMELAEPSLEEVIADVYKNGLFEIFVLPYFLFNGNHIKIDIPEKIEALSNLYPSLNIRLGTPIGKEAMMADLLLKKIEEIA